MPELRRARTTGSMLTVAVTVALGASRATAALVVDLRATHKNGAPLGPEHSPKTVIGNTVHVGDTITMAVWAQVTGSDPTKFQALQSLSGSILSSNGGLLGSLSASRYSTVWSASNSSDGLVQDLDGDGDLDVGSNNPASSANYFAARAHAALGYNSTDASGNPLFSNADRRTIPGGTEFLVGTARFVLNTPFFTQVNFRARQHGDGAAWFENVTEVHTPSKDDPNISVITYSGGIAHTPSTGQFVSGAPVFLGVGIFPEPSMLGVCAFGAIGITARRRGPRARMG